MEEKMTVPETEHVAPHLVTDQSTDADALGFTPYVRAMAQFLAHPATTMPLTVSIEGEWGAGKSSFMRQLKARLESRGFYTVLFDPWRYRTSEGLWAAFALDCIQQLSAHRSAVMRPLLRIWLFWQRLKAGSAALGLVGWIGKFAHVTAIVGAIYIWWNVGAGAVSSALTSLSAGEQVNGSPFEWVLKLAPAVLAIVPVLKELSTGIKSLEVDLTGYLRNPDYQSHQELVNRLHQDFRRVIETYAGGSRVAIFIDDLDRCSPDSTTEMMQAINLLLTDDPHIAFIMGLDRSTVAAAHAAKYEKLLPYLPQSGPGIGSKTAIAQRGQSFGLSFLEKFITIPFRLPTVDDRTVERLVASLVPHDPSVERRAPLWTRINLLMFRIRSEPRVWRWGRERVDLEWPQSIEVDDLNDYEFTVPSRVQQRRQHLRVELYEESERVRAAVVMMAPALDRNPRRIKQFVNLLRLQAYIAHETGLFDEVDDDVWGKARKPLTLEQLAKLVAISLRWPDLLGVIAAVPDGLHYLMNAAKGTRVEELPVTLQRWAEDTRLMDLLRAGCLGPDGKPDSELEARYSLDGVDINAVLAISPKVLRRDGVIIKDRPGNYTAGSLDFWRENKSKLGPIVKAVMRAKLEPDGYYLRLIDEDGNEMWFGGLNAGYSGEGPHGTLTVLVEAGFGGKEELGELIFNQASFEIERKRPPEPREVEFDIGPTHSA